MFFFEIIVNGDLKMSRIFGCYAHSGVNYHGKIQNLIPFLSSTQQILTCSKWTVETLEKGVKYVRS